MISTSTSWGRSLAFQALALAACMPNRGLLYLVAGQHLEIATNQRLHSRHVVRLQFATSST